MRRRANRAANQSGMLIPSLKIARPLQEAWKRVHTRTYSLRRQGARLDNRKIVENPEQNKPDYEENQEPYRARGLWYAALIFFALWRFSAFSLCHTASGEPTPSKRRNHHAARNRCSDGLSLLTGEGGRSPRPRAYSGISCKWALLSE